MTERLDEKTAGCAGCEAGGGRNSDLSRKLSLKLAGVRNSFQAVGQSGSEAGGAIVKSSLTFPPFERNLGFKDIP